MESSRVAQPLLPQHEPFITRDLPGPRTILVSQSCPRSMARPGAWTVHDYTLNKQLYRGKASTLFQATCKTSGLPVVLKAYSKRRLSNLNWYQVDREIRLHSGLAHENIIALYAAFEDRDHVYLVQEFAAGGDLYEDLKRSGGQYKEQKVARDILPPFLSALQYLHSRSVIHRDIKPENILLTADKSVRMADFGLSINWAEERPVTRAGTLDYMSPEVLRCPEKSLPEENKEKLLLGYTDAVDSWAVGILAYELLVGRPPFEKESRDETYQLIMHEEPNMPPWLSVGARDFIASALAKTARKRPGILDLLRHPWLLMHMRRPSAPNRPRTSLGLPLDEVPPALEQHRPSMHGATTARDGQQQERAGSVEPAASPKARPATPLALGLQLPIPTAVLAAAAGSATPPAALGAEVVIKPAAAPKEQEPPLVAVMQQQHSTAAVATIEQPCATAEETGGWQQDLPAPQQQQLPPLAEAGTELRVAQGKGSLSQLLEPPSSHLSALLEHIPPLPQAPAAAVPPEYQAASFMELYKSLAASGGPTSPRTLSMAAHSSSGSRPGTSSSKDTLPPLQHAPLQHPPPTAQRTSSFRRVISQPALHTEPLPALVPALPLALQEGSRSSNASSNANTPRPQEPLGPAAPAEHAARAASPAAAPAALPTILERTSSANEPAAAPTQVPAGAAAPGHEQQPAGTLRPTSPAQLPPELLPASQRKAAAEEAASTNGAQCAAGAAAPPHSQAHSSQDAAALDRMRDAERRHIEKLRHGKQGGIHVHATSVDVDASSAAHSGLHQPDSPQQQKGANAAAASSSIARTAESLLAKLLGKREGGAGVGAGGAGGTTKASPRHGASQAGVVRRAAAAASLGLARATSDAAALLRSKQRPVTAATPGSGLGRAGSEAAALLRQKVQASSVSASGLARAKSDAAALRQPSRSPAAAYTTGLVRAKSDAAMQLRPKASPAPRPLTASPKKGSLSSSAGARHAGLTAMQVYTVTNRGVVHSKPSGTTAAGGTARKGSVGRAQLQSSGGSVTLKTPSAADFEPTSPAESSAAAAAAGDAAAPAAAGDVVEEAHTGGLEAGQAAAPSEQHSPAAKHVQFLESALLGKLDSLQSSEQQGEDSEPGEPLIRAHRVTAASSTFSPAESFVTAASSLPSLKSPLGGGSLASSGTAAGGSRVGSRKSSLASPLAAGLGSGRSGGQRGRAKGVSLPGEQGAAVEGSHAGDDLEEEEEQVQRSAASCPTRVGGAMAGAARSAAAGPRASMYR